MTNNDAPDEKETYVFRGNEILSDRRTVAQLNYALALNRFDDRYVLKKDHEKLSDD